MSREQRNRNAIRCKTQQIRPILMHGSYYHDTKFVPVVKEAYGHAEPSR
jgi:hypothetical protein